MCRDTRTHLALRPRAAGVLAAVVRDEALVALELALLVRVQRAAWLALAPARVGNRWGVVDAKRADRATSVVGRETKAEPARLEGEMCKVD